MITNWNFLKCHLHNTKNDREPKIDPWGTHNYDKTV